MNFYAFSGLLNGIAAIAFTAFVFSRNPSDRRYQTYGWFGLCVAIWGMGYFAWQMAETTDQALFWFRFLMIGAILLPVTYLHHIILWLGPKSEKFPLALSIHYPIAILFLLSDGTPYFVKTLTSKGNFPFWPEPGLVFHFFLCWWIGLAIYTAYLLWSTWRVERGLRRTQIFYLLIATGVGYFGGLTNFPLWYDIPIPPVGTGSVSVYVAIVAYALLRYRFLDISLAVEASLNYLLLIILVALPVLPILVLTQSSYFGTVNYNFTIVQILLFFLIVAGAYKLKTSTQGAISRTLFRQRHDMYDTLSKFSKALVSILNIKTLSEEIVQTLGSAMGIKIAILYLCDREKEIYQPIAAYGVIFNSELLGRISKANVLPEFLSQQQLPLVREELEHVRMFGASEDKQIIEELKSLKAEVCLPFVNKQQLLGFCCLGERISLENYSAQDINLLTTLAREAAIALDNALLYEELKRSQELVRRTDRLRSLETMAGGLAHEIRNPLTSIKTFVDMAPQHTSDQRFLSQFSKVVKEDVSRIERLTNEILDYARPAEPFLRVEDINDIVESCLYGLRVRPSHENITVKTVLGENVPPVFVDRQQIKQVLLNLFLNALEAMELEGGELVVRTNHVSKSPGGLWAQIEVCDTGIGIVPNDLEHIFDPFFTTKHQSHDHEGTGLGLAIAYQIVREHQGHVEVKSEKGQGSTFLVSLPAYSHPHEQIPQKGQTARPSPTQ